MASGFFCEHRRWLETLWHLCTPTMPLGYRNGHGNYRNKKETTIIKTVMKWVQFTKTKKNRQGLNLLEIKMTSAVQRFDLVFTAWLAWNGAKIAPDVLWSENLTRKKNRPMIKSLDFLHGLVTFGYQVIMLIFFGFRSEDLYGFVVFLTWWWCGVCWDSLGDWHLNAIICRLPCHAILVFWFSFERKEVQMARARTCLMSNIF